MKAYEFTYMTEAYKENKRSGFLKSNIELTQGQSVIILKKDVGLFIGVIKSGYGAEIFDCEDMYSYSFYDTCEAGDKFLKEKEKAERKAELAIQMEKKFEEIDKERKFEYYATLDDGFKKLLDEYKEL